MSNVICWIEELMYGDVHVTTDELWFTISIGKGSIMAVIEDISPSVFWSFVS
jgi:hypothetical protein